MDTHNFLFRISYCASVLLRKVLSGNMAFAPRLLARYGKRVYVDGSYANRHNYDSQPNQDDYYRELPKFYRTCRYKRRKQHKQWIDESQNGSFAYRREFYSLITG